MTKLFFRILLLLCSGLFLTSTIHASETYWFSDLAPTKELAKKMRSSHGGPVEVGKRGAYNKRLWLRKGEDPLGASYVKHSQAPLILLEPNGDTKELAFLNKGYADILFPMPSEGFYNLFMIDKKVQDDTLQLSVVKKESLNHSCRAGHDHVKSMISPNLYEKAPLDIIRERFDRENFHTLMTSGDIVSFKIFRYGKPLAGVAVTLITQKGWQKTLKSDADGRVSFEMIRDYYPSWHEFKKRNMETYVVVAKYESEVSGEHEGVPYKSIHLKATAQGNYYPSTRDYQSYLYGLLIGLFALFASGIIIYIYRKRRYKTHKEIRLD
jgi:hypothetical protein